MSVGILKLQPRFSTHYRCGRCLPVRKSPNAITAITLTAKATCSKYCAVGSAWCRLLDTRLPSFSQEAVAQGLGRPRLQREKPMVRVAQDTLESGGAWTAARGCVTAAEVCPGLPHPGGKDWHRQTKVASGLLARACLQPVPGRRQSHRTEGKASRTGNPVHRWEG